MLFYIKTHTIMKAKVCFLKPALAVICCLLFNSCEKRSIGRDIEPPAPAFLAINGMICDAENIPIPDIKMVLDCTNIEKDINGAFLLEGAEEPFYSDKDGQLYAFFTNRSTSFDKVWWPSEVTITAIDTSGVYETQTRTFPVELKKRNYTNIPTGSTMC